LFCGAWGECMRQIGNAVPVKLATVIGESVMKSMGWSAHESAQKPVDSKTRLLAMQPGRAV
jgi:hypothetical protein